MSTTEPDQLLAGMEMQAAQLRLAYRYPADQPIVIQPPAYVIRKIEHAIGVGAFQRWLESRHLVLAAPPDDEHARYIVLLDPAATPSASPEYVYGPFDNRDLAEQFAEFLTAEVDPASVHELRDPAKELLNFWIQQRNGWTAEPEPEVTA